MSTTALRDLNTLPASERKNDNSNKGCFTKPCNGNMNGNVEEKKEKNTSPIHVNGSETVNAEAEVTVVEVEYIESENLTDHDDIDTTLKNLVSGLDSKDWVVVVESLNNVRRLSIFHKEALHDILGEVIPLIVKSLKNPRSAVCKTAIMTSEDIFTSYNDVIIDSLDPLLAQLLLKASQDKKFVCEAAVKALTAMTTLVSPVSLLPKLLPHLKHRNPRIRAKASMCFSRSVSRLGVEGIKTYGIDKLIQVAASQLSDQLPESREAARTLLLELQTVYEIFHGLPSTTVPEQADEDPSTTVPEQPDEDSWEHFCQSNLSPLNALAVLRVTNSNVAREGLVVGS